MTMATILAVAERYGTVLNTSPEAVVAESCEPPHNGAALDFR